MSPFPTTHKHTHTHTHTHIGILFSHKKEENLAIYDNVEGTVRHYTKWNKLEKEKYHMLSLIHEI